MNLHVSCIFHIFSSMNPPLLESDLRQRSPWPVAGTSHIATVRSFDSCAFSLLVTSGKASARPGWTGCNVYVMYM